MDRRITNRPRRAAPLPQGLSTLPTYPGTNDLRPAEWTTSERLAYGLPIAFAGAVVLPLAVLAFFVAHVWLASLLSPWPW